MIKYIKLSNYKNKIEIINLWNKEYGKIYPISEELFERNSSNLADDISYVVLDENEKLIVYEKNVNVKVIKNNNKYKKHRGRLFCRSIFLPTPC